MLDNFAKDPFANSLAVIVLIALMTSCIFSLALMLRSTPIITGKSWYTRLLVLFTILGIPALVDLFRTEGTAFALASVTFIVLTLNILMCILLLAEKSSHPIVEHWYKWAIPVLAVGGLAVAGYLAFAEATHSNPSCGPVGDCGAVQNSKYAMLFGILPVGLLGFGGYVTILIAWLVGQLTSDAIKKISALMIWGLCLFGVIFSAYLTFLEPFVIGATCMWCIASAVLMTSLLWVSTPAAQQALVLDSGED